MVRTDNHMFTGYSMVERKQRIVSLLLAAAKERYGESRREDIQYIAPYSPSPMEMVENVWERIRSQMSAMDLIVELGCGDARWIIHGVQLFGCRAVGIECDINVASIAMENVQKLLLQSNISISVDDIMHSSYKLPMDTSVVIVYAFAESLNMKIKQLINQCQIGTKVISVGFHVQGWTPVWSDRIAGLMCYFYVVTKE